MKANLHTHSIFSDGAETPEEIVRLAAEAHLELLSLTDHNSFEGYPRFQVACEKSGVRFVKGVEIDCVQPEIGFKKELLAYFPFGGEDCLEEVLRRKRQHRLQRVKRALERASLLFHRDDLSFQELHALSLRERGFEGMISNKLTYRYFLSKEIDLPSYENLLKGNTTWKELWKRGAEEEEDNLFSLICLVHRHGGFPVMPHFGFHCGMEPCVMREQATLHLRELEEMKTLGLWGVELHPYRYAAVAGEVNEIIAQWAAQIGLHLTTGSDFHGGKISEHSTFEWYGTDFQGFVK